MMVNRYWKTSEVLCTVMKPNTQVRPRRGISTIIVLKAALESDTIEIVYNNA